MIRLFAASLFLVGCGKHQSHGLVWFMLQLCVSNAQKYLYKSIIDGKDLSAFI